MLQLEELIYLDADKNDSRYFHFFDAIIRNLLQQSDLDLPERNAKFNEKPCFKRINPKPKPATIPAPSTPAPSFFLYLHEFHVASSSVLYEIKAYYTVWVTLSW